MLDKPQTESLETMIPIATTDPLAQKSSASGRAGGAAWMQTDPLGAQFSLDFGLRTQKAAATDVATRTALQGSGSVLTDATLKDALSVDVGATQHLTTKTPPSNVQIGPEIANFATHLPAVETLSDQDIAPPQIVQGTPNLASLQVANDGAIMQADPASSAPQKPSEHESMSSDIAFQPVSDTVAAWLPTATNMPSRDSSAPPVLTTQTASPEDKLSAQSNQIAQETAETLQPIRHSLDDSTVRSRQSIAPNTNASDRPLKEDALPVSEKPSRGINQSANSTRFEQNAALHATGHVRQKLDTAQATKVTTSLQAGPTGSASKDTSLSAVTAPGQTFQALANAASAPLAHVENTQNSQIPAPARQHQVDVLPIQADAKALGQSVQITPNVRPMHQPVEYIGDSGTAETAALQPELKGDITIQKENSNSEDFAARGPAFPKPESVAIADGQQAASLVNDKTKSSDHTASDLTSLSSHDGETARKVATPTQPFPIAAQPTAPAATINPAHVQQMQAIEQDVGAAFDPTGDVSVDTAGATQGSSSVRGEATGHTATATPNMAQSVSRQVAIAVAQMPDQPVEIALSPEELGRVRLVLHASEHGMVVSVQAERPETLDLMRRNIGMLAADMRDLGYSELNFTFSDHPQQQSRHPEPEASAEMISGRGDRNTDAPATVRPPPMPPLAENASGLDLRI